MDFDDFGRTNRVEFGKPVATGRSGRVLIGVIFLVVAAFCALGGLASYRSNGAAMLAGLTATAIALGYLGYRLATMSDDDYLFGRVASFVAAITMIAGGVTLVIFTKGLKLLPAVFFLLVGGSWLFRSALARKDENTASAARQIDRDNDFAKTANVKCGQCNGSISFDTKVCPSCGFVFRNAQ
jgi:hypothetical protein